MSDSDARRSDPFARTEASDSAATTPANSDPALVATTPASGEQVSGPLALTPPRSFGSRFEVRGLVGTGGMGIVFRAYDRSLDQVVALKVLHPTLARDPKLLERFRQEVRLARMITHPAVCRLHDLEEADGQRFLTMEFIDGETLAQRLAREGLLSGEEATRIGRGIAAGLGAAHAQGVLHLDLKPGNIMLARSGRVVVMDFGVARLLSPGRDAAELGVAGTVAYMAPEQLSGGELDQRTDIYALGLVLYEMACGVVPLRGENRGETALQRLQREAPDPRQARPDVPERLRRVIRRCLHRDPGQRYASADDVWRDLGHGMSVSLADLTTPLKLGAEGAARPRARRRVVAAAVLVLLAAATFGVVRWRGHPGPTRVDRIAVVVETAAAAAPAHGAAPPASAPHPEALTQRLPRAAQRLVAQELRERGLAATPETAPGPGQATARVRLGRTGEDHVIEVELIDPAAHVTRRGRARLLADAATLVATELAAVVRTAPPPLDPRAARRAGTTSAVALEELELARIAVRHRDRERAARHAQRAALADPTLPMPEVLLAATAEPFTEESRAHLRRARLLATGRTDLESRLARALAAYEIDGDDAGALKALAELHAEDPDDLDVAYCYADLLGDAWKIEQGSALLERILEVTPDHVNAMMRLFDMRIVRRDVAQLLRDGDRLVERAPEQPQAAIYRGRARFAAGQLDGALAAFGEALALDPDYAVGLKYRARALLYRGDVLGARAAARRLAVGIARRRAEGLRILGLTYLFEGRFATGLRYLDDAIPDSHQEPYELFYTLKLVEVTLEDLGDFDAALVAAQRWEREAQRAKFWAQVAYARQRQDILRQRHGDIDAPELRRRLARHLEELGTRGGADLVAGQGPKLQARQAFALGEYGEALAAALKDETPVTETQFLIGECYSRLGQHEQAARWFRRILTRPDEEPIPTIYVRAHLRLADSLAALGRTAEARELYRQFVAAWGSADRPLAELDRARALARPENAAP